jgi:hypothetical protein
VREHDREFIVYHEDGEPGCTRHPRLDVDLPHAAGARCDELNGRIVSTAESAEFLSYDALDGLSKLATAWEHHGHMLAKHPSLSVVLRSDQPTCWSEGVERPQSLAPIRRRLAGFGSPTGAPQVPPRDRSEHFDPGARGATPVRRPTMQQATQR